ncbi:histidine kinase [Defluviimonas sp. 20V17]|uniref:histidine kinase n=1 Tax=Allgaiera indica TaxID=765699 RepID=A0AAN4UPS4_9RHOB|nr:HAMP domain-containing sensor histidine kinase [Allgaiera indica]KDB03441.1 histidine kinase [Defluviimonas sp. 20V17]GHE00377.1 two-component sensor histidine kinase [Allgaiera indica]SDW62828.1 His Kinase A (phospho-acceptor) domain-containing protein [Allgaiera indica]
MRRLWRPRRGSVRLRLLVIALLPMLVLLPALLGFTTLRWARKVDNLLIVKVNGDLTIAHQYMAQLLANSGERIAALGNSVSFARHVEAPGARAYLERERRALGLDFLYVARPGGGVIASTTPVAPRVPGDWKVVDSALAGKRMAAVDVFGPKTLAALSPALAARARIPLVPTRAARPTTRKVEDDGMVLHAAAPVVLPDGTRAALVGGILLNRNLHFIDRINALVYRSRSLPAGSVGTATLFLDDVRVSTNVRLFENVRALGTRVSAVVRKRVLGEGKVWLDRAFVVNDWYISAYEPITDSLGRRVGMLYVGFLARPFAQAKAQSMILSLLAFLAIAAISVPVFLRWAGRIFGPLESMTDTIARVEAGDLSARIGKAQAEDEIGRVARHLDHLLDQVQERDQRLRDWAAELNDKVDERTRDLREVNRRLEQTTQQLVMSEKLAAVGEITASIAHEINNPVAVIQGNLDVARQTLGPAAAPAKTEFDLIDAQVHRITSIVTKLLQFARPAEFSGSADRVAPAEVVSDCLALTRHRLRDARVEVRRADSATRRMRIERTGLQQVLINLIVNALHAMPGGGTLTITTRDAPREGHTGRAGAEIIVADTGQGIAPEALGRIFDPFFTTKRAEGTGLGLSISRMLIDEAGGAIEVESTPGQGTRFTLWLPAAE